MNNFNVLRTFHTGICVADLDWSVSFFTQVLGYELANRAPRDRRNTAFISGVEGADVEIAYISGHGHGLELLAYSGPEGRAHYRARMVDVGHFHLCLVVDDVDDVVAACRSFDDNITTLSPAPMVVDQGPNKGNSIQFIALPDGVILEFTTRVSD